MYVEDRFINIWIKVDHNIGNDCSDTDGFMVLSLTRNYPKGSEQETSSFVESFEIRGEVLEGKKKI